MAHPRRKSSKTHSGKRCVGCKKHGSKRTSKHAGKKPKMTKKRKVKGGGFNLGSALQTAAMVAPLLL